MVARPGSVGSARTAMRAMRMEMSMEMSMAMSMSLSMSLSMLLSMAGHCRQRAQCAWPW